MCSPHDVGLVSFLPSFSLVRLPGICDLGADGEKTDSFEKELDKKEGEEEGKGTRIRKRGQ